MTMHHRFFVSLLCLTGWTTALAQPGAHERGPEKPVSGQSVVRYNQDQRMALRNALQAQRSQGVDVEPSGRVVRQLTMRERDELRQQLRQNQWEDERK